MKKSVIVLLYLMFFLSTANSQNNRVLFWWNFDDAKGNTENAVNNADQDKTTVPQSGPYNKYTVGGLAKYVPGVKGSAIKFDGFSSFIDVIPPDPE